MTGSILDISVEIIFLIIGQFSRNDLIACSLINRSFNIAANTLLWQAPRLPTLDTARQFRHCLEDASKHQQHQHVGRLVRHLGLSFTSSYWNDYRLSRLLDHTPGLTKLTLPNTRHVTDKVLQHLAQQCPNLQALAIGQCKITHQFQTSPKTHDYRGSQHHRHHNSQDNEHCIQVSWRGFQLLLGLSLTTLVVNLGCLVGIKRKPSMKKAIHDLTQLHRLEDLRICNASSAFIQQLTQIATTTKVWPHLTCLILEGDDKKDMSTAVADETMIRWIQAYQGGLTELGMLEIGISNTTLDAIGTFLAPTLRYLDISGNRSLSHEGIRCLVVTCPYLIHINMRCCDVIMESFTELPQHQGPISEWQHFIWAFGLDRHAIGRIRLASNRDGAAADDNDNNSDSL